MEKLPKYQWDPLNIWLVVSTPLKNMKVIWGYYSQYDRKNNANVPNHQPDTNGSL
jgi:hypothetical protein